MLRPKEPVEVAFSFWMKLQVFPLSVESSSVIEVAGVVSIGAPVAAFVSVPVTFVLAPVRGTTAGLSRTVARVLVGYFTE